MTNASLPAPAEIRERVRATLCARFGPEINSIADDTELVVALGGDRYDSLGAMECIAGVEGEFGVEVDMVGHDIRYAFATIARINTFVAGLLEDQQALDATS